MTLLSGDGGPAPVVITLTTIPPRFDLLGPTLGSLLAQDLPARIELWIPETYRRFPRWRGALPLLPDGVILRRCAQDWGPATKILPAALERRGQAVELLLVDDDSVYAPDMVRRFLAARAAHPSSAIAAIGRHLPAEAVTAPRPGLLARSLRRLSGSAPRMQRRPAQEVDRQLAQQGMGDGPPVALIARSGLADLFEGWGGVMLRPDFLAPALAEGPGECWAVDDIWLSALLALAGTPLWIEAGILPPGRRDAGARAALTKLEIDGQGRRALNLVAIRTMQAQHGIWGGA